MNSPVTKSGANIFSMDGTQIDVESIPPMQLTISRFSTVFRELSNITASLDSLDMPIEDKIQSIHCIATSANNLTKIAFLFMKLCNVEGDQIINQIPE